MSDPQIIGTTVAEGHMDPETGEPVIDKRCSCTTVKEGPGAGFIVADVDHRCPIHGDNGEGPIGGTYTVGGATFDHLGNKLGPPYPLGSPELAEHVAYMVQQCEFARKLDPVQRALWRGDHVEAARLMLAEVPADVIDILDGHDTEETP